ncbi:phosphatase PAP2 family protein [Nesterenkonia massiliensis]|uniref:phosphatase PAP2 family protein n=1 Tax=Nesterenkonia massiliensis TaxID=1232429 RepID=UPI0009DBB24C|nr:phosphatase PAP2 family protein [Nesterenkonia massiliensis]
MSAASTPLRPPARRTGLWIAGMLLCSALFILLYEYFVRTTSGQILDNVMRITADYFEHPLPPLNPENRWIAVYIVAPAAVLFAGITLARQKFLSALIAIGTVLAANISTQVLKYGWLDRPDLANNPEYWTANSLPSGHATIAASVAVAVFLVASPRQRPFIGLLAAFWGGGWGAYIFIEAWHRPSDMIAAYLVVAVWGLVGGWLIMRVDPKGNTVIYEEEPSVAPAAVLCWFFGIILSAAAGLCFLFAGGWSGINAAMDDPTLWHWLAGALLSFGPAFLLAGAGINFFGAEAGRRMRGAPVPSPRGERVRYPVPPEYRELYERV